MTNILKISSLFFSVSVRKPMIIQRPLTTTFTVYKEEKKIPPKLEEKTEIKKESPQNKKRFFQEKKYYENTNNFYSDYYEECPVCCSDLRNSNARCNYCIDNYYFPQKSS